MRLLPAAMLLVFVGSTTVDAQERPPPELRAGLRSFPASEALRVMRSEPARLPEKEGPQFKVFNGKEAPAGKFPWQVALILRDAPEKKPFSGYFCGGTLVGWKWVLTAAHCTYKNNPLGLSYPPIALGNTDIDVYVGSRNFTGGERLRVKWIHFAPTPYDADADVPDHDLVLLELASEPSTKLRSDARLETVTLLRADDREPISVSKTVTAAGWGSTQKSGQGRPVQSLQYTDELAIKDSGTCNEQYLKELRQVSRDYLKKFGKSPSEIEEQVDKWYPLTQKRVTGNMICAGASLKAVDTCFGDSGGPLLVETGGKYAQAGIVSWGPGKGCGIANLHGVYTRVGNYLTWIADKVRN